MGAERRAEMGIADGLIRLSVGIEDIADLVDDFSPPWRVARAGRATRCQRQAAPNWRGQPEPLAGRGRCLEVGAPLERVTG